MCRRTRLGSLIAIATLVCVACSGGSHTTKATTPSDATDRTYCAEVDRSFPAGASASWGARAIGLRFHADHPRSPMVVLEGPDAGSVDFLVEAVAFVGGARIELDEQIHSVSAYGRVRMPIDLSPAIGLHPEQATLPTLVRARVYVLDAAGRTTRRMVSLPDLTMTDDGGGSMRLHDGPFSALVTQDGVVQDVVESLDAPVIRAMGLKARAKRARAARK